MTIAVPVMLIPTSLLDSEFFHVLATFVALNSLIYATLAVLKVVPKGYSFVRFDGRNRRRQNRSIYPDAPAAGPSSSGGQPSASDAEPGGLAEAERALPAATPTAATKGWLT